MYQMIAAADAPPNLTEAVVHVYCAGLSPTPAALQSLAPSLSPDEQSRAAQFQFEHLRRRYIAGRGQLRLLLGRYLQTPPERIVFAYGAAGKPVLGGSYAAEKLAFNIAHSEDIALFAFTRARRLGVDVEKVRTLADIADIAHRFFAPQEQAALLALPPADQCAAFFRIWTRKEAFLKATGEGLGRPLDSFTVSADAAFPQLLSLAAAPGESAANWRLAHLEPAPDFCGALAVEGGDWELTLFC